MNQLMAITFGVLREILSKDPLWGLPMFYFHNFFDAYGLPGCTS